MSKEYTNKLDCTCVPRLAGKREYVFDKSRDIRRVDPGSVLLISEILASGVVPPDASDLDYNDIDDPHNIGPRVTNVFDAIDMSREIVSSSMTKPGSNSASAATAAPSTGVSSGEE